MAPPSFARNIKSASRTGGQAFLITVILILFSLLVLISIASTVAIRQARISELDFKSKRSYFLSESGIEDALYRAKRGKFLPASYSISLYGAVTTITVTNTFEGKEILSGANMRGVYRSIKSTIKQGTGASFFYGIQVGDLGLVMGNNATIIGNVYSNGDIDGGLVSSSIITGTAISAGNHLTRDVRVNGDAYSQRFDNCSVGGTAHYVTSFTNCTASSTVVDANPQPNGVFPITQAQIDGWKNDAVAGGTLSGFSIGNNSSATLGPQRIIGNITLGNNSVLTLTGTVWVTGTVVFGNNDTLRLDSLTYGNLSGMLIADGAIDLGNTANLEGTGQPESYLMLLSTFGPSDAIDIGNSAASAIFYAPNGVIDIGNNLNLRQATARGLRLGNNASITYEAGLANLNFFSGPSGGFDITSWVEVP